MEDTAFFPFHLAGGCLAPPDLSSVPSPAFLPSEVWKGWELRLVETETGVTFLLQQGLWDLARLALAKLQG